ncbi:MAG: helix-turn-helix domain-containing protein [Chloroflexota bacterium]
MDERELALRDRIIGVLLRNARIEQRRSQAECAEALGVPPERLAAYEEGRASISLPELEVLGYTLKTSISDLIDREAELQSESEDPDLEAVLSIRHRLIGTLLRQTRLERGLTHEDLAEVLNCSPERISDYEHGTKPVAFAELEVLARHLEISLDHFLDVADGTVGSWHQQQEIDRRFHQLPARLQAFVAEPDAVAYLKLIRELSKIPTRDLRELAEVILELPC